MTLGEFRKATAHLPARTVIVIRSGQRTAIEMSAAATKLAGKDGDYCFWLGEGRQPVLVVE